jgi:hypothetical protein
MRASLNIETTARLDSLQWRQPVGFHLASTWVRGPARHQGGRLFDDDGWHVFQLGKL